MATRIVRLCLLSYDFTYSLGTVTGDDIEDHAGEGMKKAVKAQQGKTKGGIAEQESRINVSNVQLVCASCGKPSRVGHEIKGDRKVRVCKHCEAPMDK